MQVTIQKDHVLLTPETKEEVGTLGAIVMNCNWGRIKTRRAKIDGVFGFIAMAFDMEAIDKLQKGNG